MAKILKVILELKVGKNSNFQEDLTSFFVMEGAQGSALFKEQFNLHSCQSFSILGMHLIVSWLNLTALISFGQLYCCKFYVRLPVSPLYRR